MAAGHWIPEMVTLAGGMDGLGHAGEESGRVAWEDVRRYNPDVVLVMPCSLTMARTRREFPLLTERPGWRQLSAVKTGRVFTIHTAFFHRPGPRLVQGVQLMAALLHPELFPPPPSTRARRLAA